MLFKNGHSNISCSTHSSRNLSLPIKRHSLQPLPMYLGSPLCLKERMTEGVWLPRLGQKQWCSFYLLLALGKPAFVLIWGSWRETEAPSIGPSWTRRQHWLPTYRPREWVVLGARPSAPSLRCRRWCHMEQKHAFQSEPCPNDKCVSKMNDGCCFKLLCFG